MEYVIPVQDSEDKGAVAFITLFSLGSRFAAVFFFFSPHIIHNGEFQKPFQCFLHPCLQKKLLKAQLIILEIHFHP